jgi:hypothetical protein
LDLEIFVISLCVIALGNLISYILEKRHPLVKREES